MSEHIRPYTAELEPYEQDFYTNFVEQWDMFMSQQDLLFETLRMASEGKIGTRSYEADAAVYAVKEAYLEQLEEFSEMIFDTLERGEAIDIWTNLVNDALKQRLHVIQGITVDASFPLVPSSEIRTNAAAYAAGRERARLATESNTETFQQPESVGQYSMIGIEHLQDIIASDDIEFTDRNEITPGDQYAEWVLDEFSSDLADHIDGLLQITIPEAYDD